MHSSDPRFLMHCLGTVKKRGTDIRRQHLLVIVNIRIFPIHFSRSSYFSDRLSVAPSMQNTKNTIIFTATTVGPTGVSISNAHIMPNDAQTTETIAEHTVTLLKLLNRRMAESDGNITSADISSDQQASWQAL